KTLDKSIFRIISIEKLFPRGHTDLTLKVGSAIFAGECKLNATTSALDQLQKYAQGKKHPLLITVRLSESFVEQCRQRGVSCLDLNGRVWIKAPGLLIDRNIPNASVRYRLAESEVQFFSPKSTRLARALLHSPDRTWRQSELASTTGISQGLLSRRLNHAARQGWVEGKRGDWKLADLDALLDAWEREDRWSKRVTLKQYSTLEADRRAIADRLVESTHGEVAFTQWFAASLRYPYADVPVVTAYRREFPTEDDQHALSYREVYDGGKIWIVIPRDDGVFRSIQKVEGLPLVSDAQIYLDLIHAGLRGPDQAKALRQWKGFCRT
ncbi:MAG: hypothetical protein ABIJ53_05805, partial [Verrucomicrobiota bacterium]